jgi:diadenosine tetraphosphatase ApaH/serine/threonine PP2A family protein phosphatase
MREVRPHLGHLLVSQPCDPYDPLLVVLPRPCRPEVSGCIPGDGTIDLKPKGAPVTVSAPWRPWFQHAQRKSAKVRVIFGHWSSLGLLRRPRLLGLDTGCVWGGQLTAVNLDDPEAPIIQRPCRACRTVGTD